MTYSLKTALIFTSFFCLVALYSPSLFAETPKNFYNFEVKDIHGKKVSLNTYKGQVVLVVNTASQCGFTPQFADLESLYQKYKAQGFTVLAFPSNDFKQDPENGEKIEQFSKDKYKISFPMMEKASVKGEEKQPVYKFLVDAKGGVLFKEVAWNFEKFLINRKGEVVDRWGSITKPASSSITGAIEKALAEKP